MRTLEHLMIARKVYGCISLGLAVPIGMFGSITVGLIIGLVGYVCVKPNALGTIAAKKQPLAKKDGNYF
jgi:hypothetical protein